MDPLKKLSSLAVALLLSACGEDARLSVSAALAPPLAVEMLEVTVRDGDRLIHWDGSDFRSTAETAVPSTPEVETGTSGPGLELTYHLQSAGTVISTGTVSLTRRNGWRWGVTILSSTTDPHETCLGCSGSQAFPLLAGFRPSGQDSIWVVWAGNSIDDPVVY